MAAAEQAKLRKRLEALLKLPENQFCADCGRRGPRWASANLGVFMCIECSGIHRNLGVHISFVRSVNLDSWKVEQVDFMEKWGNARANALYEARLPRDYAKPNETSPVKVCERFIRDKYEHKKFIGDRVPSQETPRQKEVVPTPAPVATTHVSQSKPAAVQQKPVAKPVVQEVNLLDFADPSPPPAAPTPVVTQQVSQNGFDQFASNGHVSNNHVGGVDPFFGGGGGGGQADPFAQHQNQQQYHHSAPQNPPQAQQNNGFGNFQNHNANQNHNNVFGDFGNPAPQQAPPKPQASADAILSLYNTPKQQGMNAFSGMGMQPPGNVGGYHGHGHHGHVGMPPVPPNNFGGHYPPNVGGHPGYAHQPPQAANVNPYITNSFPVINVPGGFGGMNANAGMMPNHGNNMNPGYNQGFGHPMSMYPPQHR